MEESNRFKDYILGKKLYTTIFITLLLTFLIKFPTISSTVYENIGQISLAALNFKQYHPPYITINCDSGNSIPISLQYFKKSLEIDATNIGSFYGFGGYYRLTGQCSQAKFYYAKVSPAGSRVRLSNFFVEYLQNYLNAKDKQSSRSEDLALYYFQVGRYQLSKSNIDEAMSWYKLSMEISPTQQITQRLVEYYLAKGDTAEAALSWRQLAAVLPDDDSEHWWAIGQANELNNNLEAALSAYENGAQVADNPFNYFMKMGDLQRELEQYGDALVSYTLAEKSEPSSSAPLTHQGVTYIEMKDYTHAREVLNRAFAIDPESPFPLYYLGVANYETGNTPGAIDYLKKAIETRGGEPWTWEQLLGDWYQAFGSCSDAYNAYSKALTWKPGEHSLLDRLDAVKLCARENGR